MTHILPILFAAPAIGLSLYGYKLVWNAIFKRDSGYWETWEYYQASTKDATEHHKFKRRGIRAI